MALAIEYQGHFQIIQWGGWVVGGAKIGKVNSGRLLQAVQIRLTDPPPGLSVIYDVRLRATGWEGTVSSGTVAGNTNGSDKTIDGLCIELVNRPIGQRNLTVSYRAFSKDKQAWSETCSNGRTLSVSGGIEALEITIQ